jgi:RimJ/RimL family protein N-acetyltransferase
MFIDRVAKKIRNATYKTNDAIWFVRELDQPVPESKSEDAPQIEFDADEEIIAWLMRQHGNFRWMYVREELEVKEKEGHIFPILRYEDKIIGYIKIGFNKVYIMDFGKLVSVPRQSALIYDTFILPEYRSRGFAAFLISGVMLYLKEAGFKKLWCHIPPWNEASIRVYTKLGFNKIEHVKYLRLLCWKFFNCNPEEMMADN